MEFDFSGESEQKTLVKSGPVPAGSKVMVRMTLEQPLKPSSANALCGERDSGMMFLPCTFVVSQGTYKDVKFFQTIPLPAGMQVKWKDIGGVQHPTQNDRMACNIGGAMLKGICEAANIPMKITSLDIFNNAEFPALLDLDMGKEWLDKKGEVHVTWYNKMVRVVTPKQDTDYAVIKGNPDGEIINEGGAVVGPPNKIKRLDPATKAQARGSEELEQIDPNNKVPF